MINGERLIITITTHEDEPDEAEPLTTGRWAEIPNPGGNWIQYRTLTHNIQLENRIRHYTIGALATALSLIHVVVGIAVAVITLVYTDPYWNSSVFRTIDYQYNHATISNPITRRHSYHDYGYHDGSYKFLGIVTRYAAYLIY